MHDMKTKEKNTLQAMGQAELIKETETIESKLAHLRILTSTKPAKNTREAKVLRLRLAVVRTLVREKEIYGKK